MLKKIEKTRQSTFSGYSFAGKDEKGIGIPLFSINTFQKIM